MVLTIRKGATCFAPEEQSDSPLRVTAEMHRPNRYSPWKGDASTPQGKRSAALGKRQNEFRRPVGALRKLTV